MLFQDFLEVIADIFGAILNFIKSLTDPLGLLIVEYIDFLFSILPITNLVSYIIATGIIVAIALIVNIKWPGED